MADFGDLDALMSSMVAAGASAGAMRQARWRARREAGGLPTQRPDTAAETARLRERRGALLTQARQAATVAEARTLRQSAGKGARSDQPFSGCDGEGHADAADPWGRQGYALFRMGRRELWRDGATLRTADLLDFICDAEPSRIHVGFAFGYDATQILRGLADDDADRIAASYKPKYLPRLFMSDAERDREGLGRGVWWRDWCIDYMPRQYLRVARLGGTGGGRGIVPKSSRTIWETFGFYQASFLTALGQFSIGSEAEREEIAAGKDRRGQAMLSDADRVYCERECDLLAELMERFRETCREGGLFPRTWNGAGKLASAMHREHETPRLRQRQTAAQAAKDEPAIDIPPDVFAAAQRAYYGGRFEVTRFGAIREPVHEHDINSAYPAAMQKLPCLLHGSWIEADGPPPDGFSGAWCGDVSWTTAGVARPGQVCGLPWRSQQRRLSWPRAGAGTYWGVEIAAAEKLGASVTVKKSWRWQQVCDCKPFAWVHELYRFRKSLGKGAAGIPIKLAINSLYGQLARRVGGGGPWSNPVWAGLITAQTRAWLIEAAALAQNSSEGKIVMLATDGIYATEKLPVPLGDDLGEWEHKELSGLFAVQPGLYWTPETAQIVRDVLAAVPSSADADERRRCIAEALKATEKQEKRKSRGVSFKMLAPSIPDFEATWSRLSDAMRSAHHAPIAELLDGAAVDVSVRIFHGLRLSHAQGRPERAGRWDDVTRRIAFDWRAKRLGDRLRWQADGSAVTRPLAGHPEWSSTVVASVDHDETCFGDLSELFDDMPDFATLGIGTDPFE